MAKPIRVLQIVTQMNLAGLESRLMDVYRNINKNKIQFDFYTCRKEAGAFDDEIKELGGRVYYCQPLNMRGMLAIPSRFAKFLNEHNEYRIIHCHLNQWCGWILKGAKKADISIRIAHSRTSLQVKNVKNVVKNIVKNNVNKYATHRFAVSKKAGEWLFGSSAEYIVWPNAIDCHRFRFDSRMREKLRSELNVNNSFVLIHVGSIRPEKNHPFLIDIFSALKEKKHACKLILIGKDYSNGKLEQLLIQKGVKEDTIVLGARKDVADFLNVADVFVFPSLYEGFPGSVLEAQASGLPCIISNTITNEVCLTTDCIQLSINISPVEWAEKVIEMSNLPRRDNYKQLCDFGYDIKSLANIMQDYYIDLASNDNSKS